MLYMYLLHLISITNYLMFVIFLPINHFSYDFGFLGIALGCSADDLSLDGLRIWLGIDYLFAVKSVGTTDCL